jgi:Trk K+ transport system NAD-binding subunit
MRIVAIYRQDKALDRSSDGTTRIEPGDEVFVLAATEHIRTVLGALRRGPPGAPRDDRRRRQGRAAPGARDPGRLPGQDHRDEPPRCEYLATQLPSDVLVLQGDSTDEDLLGDENVQDMDLFLALTSDDEDNIMACLLAKRMGARRVLALINRRAYADLVQGTQIDIAISPAQTVIGELLAYVRRGDVEAVHSLRRGAAEALEAVVRGDRKTCRMAGRRIDEIAAAGRADRRHRARPAPATAARSGQAEPSRGHHPAPRHRDRSPTTTSSSSCRASAWCARSRSCSRSARPSCSDGPRRSPSRAGRPHGGAVRAADAGAAGLCLVGPRRGRGPSWPSASRWPAALLMSLATRRFRRELQPRDGFVLVG